MPFVTDASVAACWAFPDEVHPTAAMALHRLTTDEAVVPTLWWFEIRNALVVNERRGRISEPDTAAFLRQISRLRITLDRSPAETELLSLTRRHRLTLYDASYLELASRYGWPLATLNSDLIRAAQAENLSLLEPRT